MSVEKIDKAATKIITKLHAKHPIGFAGEVRLMPGQETPLSLKWIEENKHHPQIKKLFLRGTMEGIEFVAEHEQMLVHLYGDKVPPLTDRQQEFIKENRGR